jgi:hypothetical protein
VLPGGKAVIFTVGLPGSPDNYDDSTIDAVILATGERRVVWRGAAMARYSTTGHLILVARSGSYAVPFDPDTLTTNGNPTQVVQGVERDVTTGAAHFACAADGTLAIVPGSARNGSFRLVWVDRQGIGHAARSGSGGVSRVPHLAGRDPCRLLNGPAATPTSGSTTSLDTRTRASRSPATTRHRVVGSDGKTSSTRPSIRRTFVDGLPKSSGWQSRSGRRRHSGGRSYVAWLSKDGHDAVLDFVNPGRAWAMSSGCRCSRRRDPLLLFPIPRMHYGASGVSRWPLARVSLRQYRPRGDLRPRHDGTGGRWQVSTTGGEEPHWSKDGRELYYRSGNRMMAASIEGDDAFRSGTPDCSSKACTTCGPTRCAATTSIR